MILGMGPLELVIILAVVLVIFGPKNLPKLGKSLGQTVKNVREGMEGEDEDDKAKAIDDAAKSEAVPAEDVTEEVPAAEEAASATSDADAPEASEEASEQNKFCPACGAKNPAGNTFCAKCGEKLQ